MKSKILPIGCNSGEFSNSSNVVLRSEKIKNEMFLQQNEVSFFFRFDSLLQQKSET